MHRSVIAFVPFAATSLVSTIAFAARADEEEHFDVLLEVIDGRIRTSAISEDESEVIPNVRVFGAEFGDDVFNFTDEPGFQAFDGTFSPFASVGFNILDPLSIWNGAGFDSTAHTLTISFGPLEATTADGFVPGFGILADDDGGLHEHYGFTLNGVGETDQGIYLLSLESWVDGGGPIGASLPYWIVFNLNMPEDAHEAAIHWVEENLVPAPGGVAALLAAAWTIRRTRRRHRA